MEGSLPTRNLKYRGAVTAISRQSTAERSQPLAGSGAAKLPEPPPRHRRRPRNGVAAGTRASRTSSIGRAATPFGVNIALSF